MPHADGGDAGEAMRGPAPKAAGGIVGGEREYLVECESLLKFISFLNASRKCFYFMASSLVPVPPYCGDGEEGRRLWVG